jgi:hypothetical protein
VQKIEEELSSLADAERPAGSAEVEDISNALSSARAPVSYRSVVKKGKESSRVRKSSPNGARHRINIIPLYFHTYGIRPSRMEYGITRMDYSIWIN